MSDVFDENGLGISGDDRVSVPALLEPRGEKQPSGAVRIPLPDGIDLDVFYIEDTGDVYLECKLATVSPEVPKSLFRDLMEMNFFWKGTRGFTLALRGADVMLEGRENEAYLADGEALDAWLGSVVDAVSAVLPVLTMPREDEEPSAEENLTTEA